MDPRHRMTSRQRWQRLAVGIALIALGCVVYAASQAYDPDNRGALVGIVAIIIGMSWAGQGIRGHTEGPIVREEVAPVGPPISPEKAMFGILAAWFLPGFGHWIIGRRGKAVLFFVTITATFVLGVLLAEGRNLNYERDAVYFLAYVFNLGETALGWLLTHGLQRDHANPFEQIGFLYAAVAGLLNLVVMMDFISTCTRSAPRSGEEQPA